jgi:hypothetical protein
MNYSAAITDFFKSPKWTMNMLLGGLCALIPIVGPIVTKGWLITGFWDRDDERFETFPDFDFNQFGKYLERGLWPFVVTLVGSLVLSLVLSSCAVPIMMLPGFLLADHNNEAGGCAFAILVITMVVFCLVLIVAVMFVLTPLILKASMTQDFASAFDFTFAKRLVSLTWKEMTIGSLFLAVSSLVLTCVGMLVFCIGMYFSIVVVYFSWLHFDKQLYELYLSRGGEPVPLSPKLREYAAPVASP